MELLKAASILLFVGLVIVAATASMKGLGILGKVAIGIGQFVCFIALVLAVVGFVQWMF